METYVLPLLGQKLVSEITSADVMSVLTPIWIAKPETGRKVRERIGSVMKWAIAQGYRDDNPAGDSITAALLKTGRRVEHHRALPFADVGDAVGKVWATDAWLATKLAFEFLTLTATRNGEVRLATWDEVDLNAAAWTVPAARMKGGRDHRVPLPRQAMDVLTRRGSFPTARG